MNLMLYYLHINTLAIVVLLGGQTFRYFVKIWNTFRNIFGNLPLQRNVQSSFLLMKRNTMEHGYNEFTLIANNLLPSQCSL